MSDLPKMIDVSHIFEQFHKEEVKRLSQEMNEAVYAGANPDWCDKIAEFVLNKYRLERKTISVPLFGKPESQKHPLEVLREFFNHPDWERWEDAEDTSEWRLKGEDNLFQSAKEIVNNWNGEKDD